MKFAIAFLSMFFAATYALANGPCGDMACYDAKTKKCYPKEKARDACTISK